MCVSIASSGVDDLKKYSKVMGSIISEKQFVMKDSHCVAAKFM